MNVKIGLAKTEALIVTQTEHLRTVRDLRADSKSTIKNKLTKIEKHVALVLEELKNLKAMYEKKT